MSESTALTIPQRAAVALKAEKRRADFVALAKQSEQIVAITNPASYQELHAARMRLKKARIEVTSEGEEVRDDAVKFQKGVIALQKELIGLIEPEEKRLQAIQEEHDTRVEREKAAKIETERVRVEDIQLAMNAFRLSDSGLTALSGSAVIATRIESVKEIAADKASFDEFAPEAEQAKVQALARLHKLHVEALDHEAAQRKAKADAEELARMQAAEAQRLKDAAEREAAAVRQRAEEDAKRQAEFDRIESEARLKREAEDRKAQDARDEADRVARIAREAEERKVAEERQRVAAEARALEERQREAREEQELIERQARLKQEEEERAAREKVEQERLAAEAQARAEQEAREAEQREIQRKEEARMNIRDTMVRLRHLCAEEPEYAKVVKAIDAYMTGLNRKLAA